MLDQTTLNAIECIKNLVRSQEQEESNRKAMQRALDSLIAKDDTILLSCQNCSTLFMKGRSEYIRQLIEGRNPIHFFCGQSCSAVHSNKVSPRTGNPQNLKSDNRGDEYSPFRYYLRKSKDRGFESDLDLPYLKSLWEQQEGKCAFTGIQLQPYSYNTSNHKFKQASLDRIDSEKGYVKGNVQYVVLAMNLAKGDMPDEEFRQNLKLLVEEMGSM